MKRCHGFLALKLVGPAVCQGCREPVWWRLTRYWQAWTDADGRRHRCVVEQAA